MGGGLTALRLSGPYASSMNEDRTEANATDHYMLTKFGLGHDVDQRVEDALVECRRAGHQFAKDDEHRELCTNCGLRWALAP